MKKYIINKLSVGGVFLLSTLLAEAFLFLYIGFGFLPQYIWFDFALVLFVFFVLLFLPVGRAQNILVGIFLFLQILLSYMNICIHGALGDVFTFEMLSLVDETARVITMEMLPVWPLVFYVVLFATTIVSLVLIRKKIKPEKMSYRTFIRFLLKDVALAGVTLAFFMYSIGIYALNGSEEDDLFLFSDKVLYGSFTSSKQSLKKFGTWGFYIEEFFRRFYQVETMVTYSKEELKAYKLSNEYQPGKQKLHGVTKGDNVLVIMLESFEWYAINPELTPTLYALANGYDFGNRDAETGLYTNFDFYNFKEDENGKTVALRKDFKEENGEFVRIDNVELLNEEFFNAYGLTLTNYYSKSKTDYSEASVILGNYPYNKSFTTHGGVLGYGAKNLYSDVNYSFTLPNLLKSSGAVDVTNYMHTYMSSFYGRDTLMPQFGFENTLFLDQMSPSIKRGEGLSHIVKDSEVLDYYLNIHSSYDFLPKDKTFFSFLTTVTTHGEYSYNELLDEEYKLLEKLDCLGKVEDGENNAGLSPEWAEMVKNYFASVLDTEKSITLIVKYLMENNLFDKTTLVLFSDHQSYYEGMDVEYKKLYFTDDEDVGFSSPIYWERTKVYGEEYGENSQDRFIVPAMLYSTKLTDAVVGSDLHYVDKFTCAFDLPVTIFNMMGVDYNPSFYLGYPVLCETVDNKTGEIKSLGVPAYISCTGGIFDDYIYTEDGVILKHCKAEVVLPEDLQKFSYKVSKCIEKWYKITYLYEYNMFD